MDDKITLTLINQRFRLMLVAALAIALAALGAASFSDEGRPDKVAGCGVYHDLKCKTPGRIVIASDSRENTSAPDCVYHDLRCPRPARVTA